MRQRRAVLRLELRRSISPWDGLWLAFGVLYMGLVGYEPSLEAVTWGLIIVVIVESQRDSARFGDTKLSSFPGYMLSRPVGRRAVHDGRRAAALIRALVLLLGYGAGWASGQLAPVDPAELVCETGPVLTPTVSPVWYLVLGTLAVTSSSEALSPFASISSRRRTRLDTIFLWLVWLGYGGLLLGIFLFRDHDRSVSGSLGVLGLGTLAAVTLFMWLHARDMWRRYDFVASGGRHWGDRVRWLFAQRRHPTEPASGRGGLWVLLRPIAVYPAVVWFLFVGLWLLMGVTPPWGRQSPHWLGSWMMLFIPTLIAGSVAYGFFSQHVPAYVLARDVRRDALVRAGSAAFGVGGCIVVLVLVAFEWLAGRELATGIVLLPWAWLAYLYSGTAATALSLASPVFNSPLGLVGGLVLIGATAMTVLVDVSPSSFATPFAKLASTAVALALGALAVVVVRRHLQSADIG